MNIANHWGFEDLGLGVGLRPEHYPYIFEHQPQVDWFEIISENYLDTEGRPIYYLDQIAESYPLVMHGVSMSIGSTDPIDFDYLAKLKTLAKRINARWLGDHVCWTGVNGINGHDLYPLPTNEAVLEHLVGRIKVVQDFLERPIVLENPSTYVAFADSTMDEAVFIRQMAQEADCALLLDVNNIYVSGRNHDFDPMSYLDEVPWERVVQIHLAGHSDMGTHCIDTHSDHVIDEVWALYSEAHRRAGPRSTLLEWDEDIPDFETVHAEAKKAAVYRAQAGS
jgi:uncharacterized protein (UPF0276 family)